MTRRIIIERKTKKMMLDDINTILRRWYGAETKFGNKIERLPKKSVEKLHEVAELNKNDSLHEQVILIEQWATELLCEYEYR